MTAAWPRVLVPRGVPHVLANLSGEDVRTVGLLNPTRLEAVFREQAEYFATLEGPPNHEFLMALSARYGVHPVGGTTLA